jgi:hypothetical protein
VQRRSRDDRDILHMPDGPQQQARDAAFGQGGDFEILRWLWTPAFSDTIETADTVSGGYRCVTWMGFPPRR